MSEPSRWQLRHWVVVLGLVALYVLTARLGLLLALPPENKATAVWVPSGIALAAILLYGRSLWPGIWLGAFLANLWDFFHPANEISLAAHVAVSSGIAAGSTLQALAGHFLLRRWVGSGSPFERTSAAFTFAGIAMVMCLVAATFGVVSLYLGGYAPAKALGFIWWTWWLGDMAGVLTAGSLILAWSRWPTFAWEPRRLAEAALLLVLLVLLAVVVFGAGQAVIQVPPPLAYLTIPFLVWATYRFGLHGATTALFLVSGIAVLGTSQGTGPFAQPTVNASLLLLQVYMGVVAVTALVMAAMFNERQGAVAATQTSETRYRLLLEGVPQLVWTCLPDGRCDYLSRQWAEYTGIPEADQLGYGWSEAIHPDDRAALLVRWQQAVDSGRPLDVEFRIRHGSGEYRWFKTRAVLFRQDDGTVKWFGTNTDIDDQKRASELLASQEREFRALFESAAVGMAQVAADTGRFTRVNDKFCAITGYSREELLQRGPASLNCSTEYVLGPARLAAIIRGEEPDYAAEKRYIRKDGTIVWGETTATTVRDSSGQSMHTIMVIHDVTARRVAEAALAKARDELEAQVDTRTRELQVTNRELSGVIKMQRRAEDQVGSLSSRMGAILRAATQVSIIATDPDGLITVFNSGAERMLGYAAAEVVGRHTPAILHLESEVEARAAELTHEVGRPIAGFEVFVHFARNGGHEEREWTYLHKSGRPMTVHLAVTAVRDRDGRLAGFLGIASDITGRKADEEELRQAKAAAEGASRAKGEFLANMSHEIRTPMNGILGMTDLVLGTGLQPEQREFLGLVKSSADRLLRVINDVLDFSKVEAGKLELDPAPFALHEVVGSAVRMFAPQAAEKRVELTCRIAPGTPDGVFGDADRLTQVLVNLIGNAIKFTDRGEVAVGVESTPRRAGGVELQVSVADTGVGIPADQQAAIFEAFTQGSTDLARQRGGTGLGLAISARLVELMGGRVWVESEPGRGSTFRFTVRLTEADIGPPVESPSRLVRLKGGRALVADDNPTNRRILVETVTAWGMIPEEADGGRAAIAGLERAHETRRPFQVVLADVGMPDLDGFAVAEHVRDYPGRSAAVVLLASATHPGDLARARSLGVTAVLKPISPSDLFKVVWQAVACGNPVAPANCDRPRPGSAPARSLRVLVAEDQPVNQRLIVRLLTDGGHTPILVTNGREALDRLAAEPFDVVLMDVQMPEMDGLTATTYLRAREQASGRHTRVIALTAYAQPTDRDRCLAAGCDSYLSKPIRKPELYAALDGIAAVHGQVIEESAALLSAGPQIPMHNETLRQHQ